jgi:NADH-quinone oxidoreductase subunit N
MLKLLSNMSFYVPELVCILTMCTLLFMEAFYGDKSKGRTFVYITAMIGLAIAFAVLACSVGNKPQPIFYNALIIDSFSTVMKMIMVLGTLGVFYLCSQSTDIYEDLKTEFLVMTIGVLIGGMLLSSANNLLTVYLGIETLSILSYVLAAFKKRDGRSSEAGLKYVLYGGITAGVMLYGISHIYGILGTIQFSEIPGLIKALDSQQTLLLLPAFVLFFVGIGYKIACVPFHMWSPDVYEGSPVPVTTFFSIVPKLAGMAVLIRVTLVFFNHDGVLQTAWVGLMQVLAALTMFVGNITAINQKSVKRMLAFSSIAHAGFMMCGILVLNATGIRAILFYGATYLFMTLLAFYVTSFIIDKYGTDDHERFTGLISKHPLVAISMSVALFSLAGLPPFSGFIAKFNILSALIESEKYSLALIAVLNSVISLYYYLRLVKTMCVNEADSSEPIEGLGFVNQAVIVGLGIPVILLGVFWEKLMLVADGAKIFIQ